MRKTVLTACSAIAAALLAAAPAHAAWHEVRSRHFIIYADERPDILKDYATRLEKFDRAVRQVRGMADPDLTDSGRIRMFIVSDFENIDRFLGIENARGIYIPRTSGTVTFVPKIDRSTGPIYAINSQIIFFHEYAHHLMLQSTNTVVPHWLVEGSAEFFSTAKIEKDGSVRLGIPANHRAETLFTAADLPLRDMLGGYQSLTDAQEDDLYGRGWLLTHYLNFEPSRRGQLDRFIAQLQGGQPAQAAAENVFGDLKKLDSDLGQYRRRRRLTTLVIPPESVAIGQIIVRPMRAGEAAIMPVRARSTRGVDSKTARKIVTDARRIAGQYPTEPAVMLALTEAEFDIDNFAAAEAAADRTMALDPRSNKALIYKARSMEGSAEAAKQPVPWGEIRKLLIRANRLDPDDPEPLSRYYMSFPQAGEAPSKNAVTGLLYAAELVPQVKPLRFVATQQLLRDKNFARARLMYAPIAYDPHQSVKERERSARVMAAINAGNDADARAALAAGDEEDDTSSIVARPSGR